MTSITPIQWLWVAFVTGFLVASAISWHYLYRIYKDDPEPLGSWILDLLQIRAFVDVVCVSTLALLFFRNTILGFGSEDWTKTLSGASILFLATGPIHKALIVARERRRLGK